MLSALTEAWVVGSVIGCASEGRAASRSLPPGPAPVPSEPAAPTRDPSPRLRTHGSRFWGEARCALVRREEDGRPPPSEMGRLLSPRSLGGSGPSRRDGGAREHRRRSGPANHADTEVALESRTPDAGAALRDCGPSAAGSLRYGESGSTAAGPVPRWMPTSVLDTNARAPSRAAGESLDPDQTFSRDRPFSRAGPDPVSGNPLGSDELAASIRPGKSAPRRPWTRPRAARRLRAVGRARPQGRAWWSETVGRTSLTRPAE